MWKLSKSLRNCLQSDHDTTPTLMGASPHPNEILTTLLKWEWQVQAPFWMLPLPVRKVYGACIRTSSYGVTSSWLSCSVWTFVCGWKPEDKLTRALSSAQNSVNTQGVNWGPRSKTLWWDATELENMVQGVGQFLWQRVETWARPQKWAALETIKTRFLIPVTEQRKADS